MRVIGIDPGTATTGYGVVEEQAGRELLVAYGVISTPSGMDMPLRLLTIHREINGLLEQYRPEAVAVEEIFHHKNARTVVTVAQSRGVILMTAAAAGIDIAEYTPLQVKQAVVGYGQAEKKQIQLMVQKILHMKELPRPDDAADGLALALCHLHSYRIGRMLRP